MITPPFLDLQIEIKNLEQPITFSDTLKTYENEIKSYETKL